jgi:hypothetical protein
MRPKILLILPSVLAALAVGPACDEYEGPPIVTLPELHDGLLADPAAPVLVAFSKAPDVSSMRFEIIRYQPDIEGNLADEDTDESTQLSILFTHDESEGPDRGGRFEMAPDGLSMRIFPSAALPTNPRLALVFEPGLADVEGHKSTVRRRIVFGYELELSCTKPSAILKTGKYFVLFDVKKPLSTQVQLWASFRVNEQTGEVAGQFTNADRNLAPNRCPTPCKPTEACRLLPAPACVIPSERAGSVDEFPDWVPNPPPNPTGYSFTARGCVEDHDDGTASFAFQPTDIVVNQPQVTLRNARLAGTFSPDTRKILTANGSIGADEVLIGQIPSGRGEGTFTARQVPDAEAAPGIPDPP